MAWSLRAKQSLSDDEDARARPDQKTNISKGSNRQQYLSSRYSIDNTHSNNDTTASNDGNLYEEDVNQLCGSDSRFTVNSSEEVELEEVELGSSTSHRRRCAPFPGTLLSNWLNFSTGYERFRSSFQYDPLEDSLREVKLKRPPRQRRKITSCIFALIILFFTTLGVFQFILLVCGAVTSFSPEGLDEDWENQGQGEDATQGVYHWPTDATRDIAPVACHSHNDYWRKVPLFSAITAGCTGVEADVWLINNELYVGHKRSALTEKRTLQSLYVTPLVELLDKQNPITQFHPDKDYPLKGVFDTDPEQSLVLLIDFKTNGQKTWPHVVSQLFPLRDRGYLSYYDGEKVVKGPITVVATGNAEFDQLMANSTYRDIFFDAPLDKLPDDARRQSPHPGGTSAANEYNSANSYYASVSYKEAVGYPLFFQITPTQRARIRAQIEAAHRRGLKVRYWSTPTWPRSLRNDVWTVLEREGVDYLNVDDLKSATAKDWRHRFWDWWF